jgi:hypothetical protein
MTNTGSTSIWPVRKDFQFDQVAIFVRLLNLSLSVFSIFVAIATRRHEMIEKFDRHRENDG